MAADVLPEKLAVPTRDELVRRFERDWQLRIPTAKVGAGTIPGITARVVADMLLPVYGEAKRIAQIARLEDMDGAQLEDEADKYGLPRRLEAAGSSGAVTVTTASGGGTIFEGDEIKDEITGFRWACSATAVYTGSTPVPILGVDTGAATNVPPGRKLKWTSPRPGIAQEATVVTQSDGSGLSGGRDVESDAEIVLRIKDARRKPAVAGNDAAYRDAAVRVPNIGLQAAFTYPAVLGPGTTGLAFTLRPATPGASRIPNPTQRAAVRAAIVGQFPKDDALLSIALIAMSVDVRLRVRWASGARGWTDAAPWPAYDETDFVYVKAVTSATSFQLASADTAHVDLGVGQTIGFYDAAAGAFVRKKVLTASASTSGGERLWAVVCDTANGASDAAFTPAVGDRPSPWSDSLDALAPAIIGYFDTLGPGELLGEPYLDEGSRQRRQPESPAVWPSEISGRLETPLYELPAVSSARVVEPELPYPTPVGVPGVSANLLELGGISAHPL